MSKAERIHIYRRHWGEEIVILVVVVAAAGVCLGLVRSGQIDREPWGYIATAVAILGALSAMMLTIVEAMRENNVDE